jgi:hypothetical protein
VVSVLKAWLKGNPAVPGAHRQGHTARLGGYVGCGNRLLCLYHNNNCPLLAPFGSLGRERPPPQPVPWLPNSGAVTNNADLGQTAPPQAMMQTSYVYASTVYWGWLSCGVNGPEARSRLFPASRSFQAMRSLGPAHCEGDE